MKDALASYIAAQRSAAKRALAEERSDSPDEKLAQLARLMRSVDGCGLRIALSEGDAQVRGRWQELRRRLGGA